MDKFIGISLTINNLFCQESRQLTATFVSGMTIHWNLSIKDTLGP